jgi:cytochrome c2
MFQRHLFLILSATVLMSCTSSSPLREDTTPPDTAHGQSLYKDRCSACHDAGKNAPSIKEPEEWDTQRLAASDIIRKHQSMRMPAGFAAPGHLSAKDEKDVLAYLKIALEEAELKY